MQIVIDIDEKTYADIKKGKVYSSYRDVPLEYVLAIANGTPLDEVIAEIAENKCLTDNPYTNETKYTVEHLKLLEIFDKIGKEESKRA